MPAITFQSAVLNRISRKGKEGRASFTTSLSQAVCKALEWDGNIPDCLASVSHIKGFEIVRRELESARGKGHRLELRFTVGFSNDDGCARLERYMLTIGEGKGKLAISYQKQAVQDKLISEEQAQDTAVLP